MKTLIQKIPFNPQDLLIPAVGWDVHLPPLQKSHHRPLLCGWPAQQAPAYSQGHTPHTICVVAVVLLLLGPPGAPGPGPREKRPLALPLAVLIPQLFIQGPS